MTRLSMAAFAACITVLGACATGPRYLPPASPGAQTYVATPVTSVVLGAAPAAQWWTQLKSQDLDAVVELALNNNLSLAAAKAHLATAEERLNAARGARSVQVDAAAGVARRKYGSNFLGPLAKTFPTFSPYTVGPSVSYDFDLFGETRHRIEAAGAGADYEREQLRAVRLRVIGDTVIQALNIAAIRAHIAVVQQVLTADEKTLDLVRAARRAGVISDIDVLQATSQRDQDRTLLPPLYEDLDVARDALSILVGRTPSEWTSPDFVLDRFVLPPELNLVVPSELVRARPDIRASEAQLRQSSAQVGIATAELYPHVSLTAGWAAEGLLSSGTAAAWSVVGGLTAPIFHGGTLTAQRRGAQDEYQSTFAQYQLVVLQSFAQVADILHALDHDAEALEAQRQALASADGALELTRQGYRVGNADILQILTAQRFQQLAQLGDVQARAQQLTDAVRLSLASGGSTEL